MLRMARWRFDWTKILNKFLLMTSSPACAMRRMAREEAEMTELENGEKTEKKMVGLHWLKMI